MFDARIVANEVLRRAQARGVALTNLDLQKIVYFLHGASLRHRGEPLVEGDFQAWQWGPVHRVMYDAFRTFGDAPVDAPARRFDPLRRQFHDLPKITDPEIQSFLDSTLDKYLDLPTFMLVQITHAPGTPWSLTMEEAESKTNVGMVIRNEVIARYFEGDTITTRRTRSRRAGIDAETV